MVSEAEASEIDAYLANRRMSTRAAAIRSLMRSGLDLPLLCIDLLDGLEMMGVLNHPKIAKEVLALEGYLGTSRQDDYADRFSDREDNSSSLTDREQEVAFWIKKGASNKDIALNLHLSENTVRVYVHNILRKLKASNRSQIAARTLSASVRISQK